MILLVAAPALALAALLIAARAMPEASPLERACGAAALAPAAAIGIVYALGAAGAIAPLPWLGAVLALLLGALGLGGAAAWAVLWADAIAARAAMRELARDPGAIAALAVAGVALALAALSSALLSPWQWDSLGYHLPIVHDALQTGTLRHVPTSVVYVNVYPRLVDVFFVAWRLSLGDDRWIELGQLPFAIGGVLAIATIAERAGVPAWRAVALGALWLAVPVVMLELAAAYVDVAVGALALMSFALATGAARPGALLIAGIAIGVLLGSKPSAPPVAAIAMAVLLARAARARAGAWGVLACAVSLGIGVWKYVENVREWGNPIWPAHARLGPIVLPGKASTEELATSGLTEPYLSQGWLGRVISSWTALPDAWVYDMRIGGFGPLFTFGLLPLAIAAVIVAPRSRAVRRAVAPVALPVVAVVAATLASPGAFWARYTCAIPGALLALAIAIGGALPARGRRTGEAGAILLAAIGIALSWRGFTPDAPSLLELARTGDEEARTIACALDRQEEEWLDARARIGEGEAFGYDPSYGLPGRLWRPDGRGRVVYLEETTPTVERLRAWAARERVRVVVLGEGPTGSADAARARPDLFRELFRSQYPEWQPCAVFEVLRER